MLDMDCGDGKLTSELIKHGAKVYGADLSQRALRVDRSFVPEEIVTRADGANLEFENACMDGIEHLPDIKDEKALMEIKRVLKLNGRLILSVMSYPILRKFTRLLVRKCEPTKAIFLIATCNK